MDFDNDENLDYQLNKIASNIIKEKRLKKGYSLEELANKLNNIVTRQSLFRYETNEARMKNTIFKQICLALDEDPNNIWNEINNRLINSLLFDNATPIDIDTDIVKIPVYGTIKAGIPIESQSDIIDYIDIPKDWTRGGKSFYGLKISGDSMFPKYSEDDIVIFEQNNDVEMYNGKDCAIMINSSESTFKKIILSENGIELKPYNKNYEIMTFTSKEVEELPIKIVGIAVEIRKKVSNLVEEDKKLIEMAKDLEEITKEELESLSALDNILYENKGKIDSVRNLPIEKQQIIANAVKSVLDLVDDNENKL